MTCPGCGHAHNAHRAPSITAPGSELSCSAAIPVRRDGAAPPPGAYTTGEGSVKFGSVCPCVKCECPRCAASLPA